MVFWEVCVKLNIMNTSSSIDILRWHLDAGVDETIGLAPVNHFDLAGQSSVDSLNVNTNRETDNHKDPIKITNTFKNLKTNHNNSLLIQFSEIETLSQLQKILEKFDGCFLKKTATNLVFAHGSTKAKIMFVGPAPGTEEDREGTPFVGASGTLLDGMIKSIGIDRSSVMLSNLVFWRPPGNRTPTSEEIKICLPFLQCLIRIVNPLVLVALGGLASDTLFNQGKGIHQTRGKWLKYKSTDIENSINAITVFHPDYLINTPEQKKFAWRDLLTISERLK
jgi:DNA polymerase